ncbi:oligopeptide ABC transporter permease [Lentibacillus sp. CBA3610]|uniref:oligopeptide ABC transporter permease n=1 Tax=Lentibacillus sp. CBA3610 TaxID=2518176 RepID=UPI00159616C1|nr:oligopeptide ABC transporter permease [Lentibacillus sp. CBA3610]QKY71435.1 ABC transporter permease [Lentibacillus sp. CBA3610]
MQSNPEEQLSSQPENTPGSEQQESKSPFQLAMRRFMKNKMAVISVFVIFFIIIICVMAPVFTDQDPEATNVLLIEQGPSDEHILGTNGQGQDNFSRLLYGGRISLIVGFSAMFFTLVIGVFLGSLAGYYGGKVDGIIMRAADIMLMLPFLVLALTIIAIIEEITIPIFVMIIALTSWPNLTRIIRGTYLSLREQEFVHGARAIGASDIRIIIKHFIPNAIGPIIVNATLMMATYIIIESGLSFIGFGIPQPTPTWGNMISEAMNVRILREHPEAWIPPGLAIFVTVLAINFIGDGMRDAFDPKSKQR